MTKYAYFVPYRKDIKATEIAYLFQKTIISRHGIPQTVISDRDKLFTLVYWNTILADLGIKNKLSIAFYPQTDG